MDNPPNHTPFPTLPLSAATLQVGVRLGARSVPGLSTRPGAQPSSLEPLTPGTCAAQPAPPVSGGQADEEEQEEGSRVIERRTYSRALPDGRSVLRQLTRPVQLQEACFRDVVLLYRPAAAAGGAAEAAAARGRGGQAAASVEESVGGETEQARMWDAKRAQRDLACRGHAPREQVRQLPRLAGRL